MFRATCEPGAMLGSRDTKMSKVKSLTSVGLTAGWARGNVTTLSDRGNAGGATCQGEGTSLA